MFSKPFRIKSNSQLKGSERKKLRSEILKSFPRLTDDDLQVLLPNKEVIIAMKIFTYSGSSVQVYCVQKLPIIFEIEQVFYPTVYMLWQFPDLLPSFTTWPLVYPKIIGGADLMLPGVVLSSNAPLNITSYGNLKKGDRISVNLTNNKAAVAVGQAAIASDDMYMAARRGKAVKILHCVNDTLWLHGTKAPIPELGPPQGYHQFQDGKDDDLLSSTSVPDAVDDSPRVCDVPTLEKKVENLSVENPPDVETAELEVGKEEDPQANMDFLIEYCFLKAWKGSAKKTPLPLLSSTFYKLHMIPACPTGVTLDIKKSSYKKLSKFLSTMAVAGIIQLKELTKGVESIMSVNVFHERLMGFVDTASDTLAEAGTTQQIQPQNHLAITETYSVTATVLPIMALYGCRKGTKLSPPDIRKHLTDYVKTNNLQNAQNPSLVRLDPLLQRVCISEKEVTEISWQSLMQTFLGSMTHNFQIGASPFQAKGKLEPIDIQVASRMGNKKVTLVYNLELYNIDLTEFARTCQHGVAASTSISTVTHRKGSQLLIQGNQVHFVGKLLQEKYEIPKKYIRGLEKAIKPKK